MMDNELSARPTSLLPRSLLLASMVIVLGASLSLAVRGHQPVTDPGDLAPRIEGLLIANITEERRTEISELVAEGRAVSAETGLFEDDPDRHTGDDLEWDGREGIEFGIRITKVEFEVDTWIKGSSAETINLILFHYGELRVREGFFISQDLVDAAFEGKRLRIWADESYSFPTQQTHWMWDHTRLAD